MTKEKKIIVVISIILILVITIFSYFLINKNAIIKKQAEEIELQAMETNGSNSYITTEEHLKEFTSYEDTVKQLIYLGRHSGNNSNKSVKFTSAAGILADSEYISYTDGIFTINKKCTLYVAFSGKVTNNNSTKVIKLYKNNSLFDTLSGTLIEYKMLVNFEEGDTFYFYQNGSELNESLCCVYK